MINVISAIKTVSLKTVSKVKKFSPEILLGVGVVGIFGGVILACVETLKVNDIFDEHLEERGHIDARYDGMPENTNKDKQRDICKLYGKTGIELAKNYAPAAGCLVTGMFCIFSSYGIMRKRNLTAVAAASAISQAFDEYRQRVKDAIGEEKEKDIRYGTKQEKIEVKSTDEAGNETVKKEKQTVFPDLLNDPYAKFFDELNPNWCKNPEHNLNFLKMAQNWANDLFNSRGHVFLNEVYDMLGIPRTAAGAVCGWVKGAGDDFIDFGIYDGYRKSCREFVNGYESSILLSFNVDGVIYDKI